MLLCYFMARPSALVSANPAAADFVSTRRIHGFKCCEHSQPRLYRAGLGLFAPSRSALCRCASAAVHPLRGARGF